MNRKEHIESLFGLLMFSIIISICTIIISNGCIYDIKHNIIASGQRKEYLIFYAVIMYIVQLFISIYIPSNYKYLIKNGATKDSIIKRTIITFLPIAALIVSIVLNIVVYTVL